MNDKICLAGADNETPSIPQYFSWINSTNEGSTEKQTIINLDYFRYMKDTYGMELKLYAWDAGNFDGASEGYGDTDGEKFRGQYPEGYKNVVRKASETGIRMGLWGSPDGYGDDPETEWKRYEFFVHLCRDYHFMEFKFDGVCGELRREKAQLFAKMLQECRKYSPDLIVLNHRLPFYEAEPYITTFLWQGAECYTDVSVAPSNTAMHNRSHFFTRGLVPEMKRLCEDHGVCISSSIDYFEDEMIYQAFSRSLILAPETYGNPWLLKDSEQPRYARIYNLHRRNADILVNGIALSESLGAYPVSRGNEKKRFICTGNNSWTPKTITVTVDESIGITEKGNYQINLRHPHDEQLCVIPFGASFTYTLTPFRATLIEIAREDVAEPIIPEIAYEVIKEDKNGNPLDYRILRNKERTVNLIEASPIRLGSMDEICDRGDDDEFLYESAMFAISNDSLEAQSRLRAGKTAIPEIQAARDAFFNQETYILRGCESSSLFDGNPDTLFDAQSRCYCDRDLRIDGGCLRVDFGAVYDADEVEIVAFSPNEPTREVLAMQIPENGTFSADLHIWQKTGNGIKTHEKESVQRVSRFTVHTIYKASGKKITVSYPINGKLRYLRLPSPMDHIYSVSIKKDGKYIKPVKPFANNMMAPYEAKPSAFTKSLTVKLPEYRAGAYLAVAVEGKHGKEGCYAVCTVDGKTYGFNRRSSAYPVNNWEHRVVSIDSYYTFFLDLPEGLSGKTATVTLLVSGTSDRSLPVDVYLCDKHD